MRWFADVLSSREAVEGYPQPIDMANEEYEAFDSVGRLLVLTVERRCSPWDSGEGLGWQPRASRKGPRSPLFIRSQLASAAVVAEGEGETRTLRFAPASGDVVRASTAVVSPRRAE
jgi:hypothetical protein